MPILIPIEDGGAVAPLAVAAGSSSVSGTLSVDNRLRVVARGSSLALASLSLGAGGALALAGASAGTSAPSARLRLNGEANIDLASSVACGSSCAATMRVAAGLAGRSEGAATASASLSVDQAEEFGFTIFLDVIGAGLQGGTVTRYRARLVADGSEVPVKSFDLNAPEGALGVSLSVTLAKPDVSLVTGASELQFDLGVWTGSAFEWVTMLSGGKLAGRSLSIAFARGGPDDEVSLTIIDPVADRWTLAPAAPITYYNPDEVEAPAPPSAGDLIVDEKGAAVMPVSIPVYGLRVREVMRLAYVEGCAFEKVVTNVPDFPVSAVTFSLEGGYHEAVRPLLSLFEPVYFADGDTLWIIDAGAPLPAGLAPRELPLSAVVSVTDTAPARQPASAIIVVYKSDGAGGEYFTERVEQESREAGQFGEKGYTRTVTERRVREYRNFDAPETIVREAVASTKVTTTDHEFKVAGRETQTDSFDSLGRKSGHKRTVEARVPDLEDGGKLKLQKVAEDAYTVLYRASLRAGSDEIAATITKTSGLVLIDADKEYLGKPYEIPYTDAHQSGYLDPDAGQSAEFRALRTVTETYVRAGASTEVRRQVVNYLNGGSVENTTAQTRAGTTAVSRRAQGVVRRKLTLAGATEGRIVPSFGTGDMPGDVAIDLGRRKLAALNSPPRQFSASLPVVAFDIRRGTPVRPHSRSGAMGTYIILSSRVTGENLGTHRQIVRMGATGKELKS